MNNKNKTLGEAISYYRTEKRMTQSELANKLLVSAKTISKWEKDLSRPDVTDIFQLAKIFNVKVDNLINFEIPKRKKSTNSIDKYIGISKVGEKGKIVIPKEVRDMFDIKSGDYIIVLGDKERGIVLAKADVEDIINKIFAKWDS